MKTFETVDEIVEYYFQSSSPFRSKIYVALGSLFVVFALIGILLPGWPTVSWAVPAAFLFSLSNEKLFRWSLSNKYFGSALFHYHVKLIVISFILLMSIISSYFVFLVSTVKDGDLTNPPSWNGKDPGFGAGTIMAVGLVGVWYVLSRVKSR